MPKVTQQSWNFYSSDRLQSQSLQRLCSVASLWLEELNAFATHFFETPECVSEMQPNDKGSEPRINLPPAGTYTEPVELGFQAVPAPGCPCELLAGRLVPCHLPATLSSLQGFLPPAPTWEPRSKHLHFVQGRPWRWHEMPQPATEDKFPPRRPFPRADGLISEIHPRPICRAPAPAAGADGCKFMPSPEIEFL